MPQRLWRYGRLFSMRIGPFQPRLALFLEWILSRPRVLGGTCETRVGSVLFPAYTKSRRTVKHIEKKEVNNDEYNANETRTGPGTRYRR